MRWKQRKWRDYHIIKGGKCKTKGPPFQALWSQRDNIMEGSGNPEIKRTEVHCEEGTRPPNESISVYSFTFDCFAVIFLSVSEYVYLQLFYYAPFDECVVTGLDYLLNTLFILIRWKRFSWDWFMIRMLLFMHIVGCMFYNLIDAY